MRCHYYKDSNGERYLIPGCWPVAQSNDIGDCTCPDRKKSTDQRVIDLEIKVKELTKQIKEMKAILDQVMIETHTQLK